MQLIEILSQLGIPYATEGSHHCRPGWIQIDCPYCAKNTQKWHLGIPLNGGPVSNCWRCGPHPTISALAEYTGLSYQKVKQLFGDISPSRNTPVKKKRGKLILPSGVDELQVPHIRYLQKRGFEDVQELTNLWNLKGIGVAPKLSWSIFIPVYFNGRMVSWTSRSLSNNGRRYHHAAQNQEEMSRNELLYGQDLASHAIIICEGPFDVWKIGPGAVATLGTNYSKQQVLKMTQYPVRYVCFDNEPVAQSRAQKLTDLLSVYKGQTYNIQLDSKDAGEASKRELIQLRRLLK